MFLSSYIFNNLKVNKKISIKIDIRYKKKQFFFAFLIELQIEK